MISRKLACHSYGCAISPGGWPRLPICPVAHSVHGCVISGNSSIVSHSWTLPPSFAGAQRHLLTSAAGSDGCPMLSRLSSLSLSCSGGGVASGRFAQSSVGAVHSVLSFEVDFQQLLRGVVAPLLPVRAAPGGRRHRYSIDVLVLFASILEARSVEAVSLVLSLEPGAWWSAWQRLGSASVMLVSPPVSRIANKTRPPNPHKPRLPVPRLLFSASARPLL